MNTTCTPVTVTVISPACDAAAPKPNAGSSSSQVSGSCGASDEPVVGVGAVPVSSLAFVVVPAFVPAALHEPLEPAKPVPPHEVLLAPE
jgi:hypothetical protein